MGNYILKFRKLEDEEKKSPHYFDWGQPEKWKPLAEPKWRAIPRDAAPSLRAYEEKRDNGNGTCRPSNQEQKPVSFETAKVAVSTKGESPALDLGKLMVAQGKQELNKPWAHKTTDHQMTKNVLAIKNNKITECKPKEHKIKKQKLGAAKSDNSQRKE